MIGFRFRLELADLQKASAIQKTWPAQALAAMWTAARAIQRRVMVEKLLGQVLHRRTGNLLRTIQEGTRAEGIPDGARAIVGTSSDYGRFWELGGTIPAHTVRPLDSSGVLAFVPKGAGGMIFRKFANIPARTEAARPYIRPSAEEELPGIRKAVVDGFIRAGAEAGVKVTEA